MSDDEHEHEHHVQPFFTFFGGPSKEEVDRMRLEGMASAHENREFMNGLDETQLTKLIDLITIVRNYDSAGWYYTGVLSELLDKKHGMCMACGHKHDEELANLTGDGGPAVVEEVKKVEPPVMPAKGSEPYDKLMDRYNTEQDDDGSDRVMCKGCGMWYQSLADRMLRPASKTGCEGCVQKEQWG